MRKYKDISFWLIWATMMCVIFVAIGFAAYPLKPVTLNKIEILDADNTITAGEPVHFTVWGMKHTDRPSKVIYQLVNTRVTTYSAVEGNLAKGTDHYSKSLPTSKYDMAGTYYIRTTVSVKYFGGLREVTVAKDSAPFTMVCSSKAKMK
jgi:hypothetical protein